jgi:hypothetical protein
VTSPRPSGRRIGVRAWLLTLLTVVGLLVFGAETASAARLPDAGNRVRASAPETITAVGVSEHIRAGQGRGPPVLQGQIVVATGVAAEAGQTVDGVGNVTAHGAERVAGAGATRGGVLSADEINAVRQGGQILRQADGATVRILQNDAGRFDVVVDGEKGLITTFRNLSEKSLHRLSKNYGWGPGQ